MAFTERGKNFDGDGNFLLQKLGSRDWSWAQKENPFTCAQGK